MSKLTVIYNNAKFILTAALMISVGVILLEHISDLAHIYGIALGFILVIQWLGPEFKNLPHLGNWIGWGAVSDECSYSSLLQDALADIEATDEPVETAVDELKISEEAVLTPQVDETVEQELAQILSGSWSCSCHGETKSEPLALGRRRKRSSAVAVLEQLVVEQTEPLSGVEQAEPLLESSGAGVEIKVSRLMDAPLTSEQMLVELKGFSLKAKWKQLCTKLIEQGVELVGYSKLSSLETKSQFLVSYSVTRQMLETAKGQLTS